MVQVCQVVVAAVVGGAVVVGCVVAAAAVVVAAVVGGVVVGGAVVAGAVVDGTLQRQCLMSIATQRTAAIREVGSHSGDSTHSHDMVVTPDRLGAQRNHGSHSQELHQGKPAPSIC